MTQRAFPTTPTRWTNADGTLTPEARRFLHGLFSQLGGAQPVDLGSVPAILDRQQELDALITQMDHTLFFVLAPP